jgi:hypothetical protein
MEPSKFLGFIRKGRDLDRSAIITERPRAAAVPVLEATEGKAAGATKAAAQGRRAARAKEVFMVLGWGGCVLCVYV